LRRRGKKVWGGSWCCWRQWRWQDIAASDDGGADDDGSHRFFLCFFSVFSSLLLLFFLSRFSPLYPYSAPLFFLSIPLLCTLPFCSLFLVLLFSPSLLSLVLLLSFFYFALSSPVFIGKKQGRERPGWPLCCRPSTVPPICGKLRASGGSLVGVFLGHRGKRRRWEQGKKKSSSSSASRVQGKKKTHSAVKTTPFQALFF